MAPNVNPRAAAEGVRATNPFDRNPESDPPPAAATQDYRWGVRQQKPVAVDTPPPPQRTATETHYVPYETDGFARAHQWASEQVARKYPGSIEVLTTLDSLIKQQLNGDGDS
ncbi:MAG: hypothetical protein AAGJ46_07715 [Planctomycetota bacterium]